jgi:hypothetical protein
MISGIKSFVEQLTHGGAFRRRFLVRSPVLACPV